MANLKGIFKAAIAGATAIGAAILGNEARKCFTKPVSSDTDEFDDVYCEETTEATEDPAEEAENDEPAEAED